jgi:low temperature requirement protein LtrA
MVAGVIVVAVAVRLTIEDPSGAVSPVSGTAMLAGPAIYLAGVILFKRAVHRGALGPPRLGIFALALLTIAAVLGVDRLVLCIFVAVVLATLAFGAGAAD